MTPPRFPLGPSETLAVAYAVAILRALADASGNHERAAEALGMSKRTMDDHIARLGMTELQRAIWPRSGRQPKKGDQRG